MNLKKIIYSLSKLERLVLENIHTSIQEISQKTNLSEEEVKTGLMLLEERGYLKLNKKEKEVFVLDKLGEKYKDLNLPEIIILKEILNGEKQINEFSIDEIDVRNLIGFLKKNDLCEIIQNEKKQLKLKITKKGINYLNENKKNPLLDIENNLEFLQKRKGFIKMKKKILFSIELKEFGEKLSSKIKEKYSNIDLVENLKVEDLKTRSWKNKEFRRYNINLKTQIQDLGRRHPMMRANEILSEIFIEMGFKEMEGPIIESEFWCFDALWIPQDHPARDEQDSFFLDGKAVVDDDLCEKVAKLHEDGILKGHTPKGQFSHKITKRRVLRTHSTATSFRYLKKLGERLKKGENIDGKYFYVAHNFRNEAIDATHLAEFFQGEGFIIGDDLSLANLMGFIIEYYKKFGIDKIKFKPTFNPYTEPSMEAHYYDEKMKKWYALINSGIFREETLKPFGLEKKKIIAWGMGASRVATLLSNKSSMREITGATCDFKWLKKRSIMKRKIVR
jgi:phenylalanyl-tRNA synthetase alpha chain